MDHGENWRRRIVGRGCEILGEPHGLNRLYASCNNFIAYLFFFFFFKFLFEAADVRYLILKKLECGIMETMGLFCCFGILALIYSSYSLIVGEFLVLGDPEMKSKRVRVALES